MDPRYGAQDVSRCDLCEQTMAEMYCDSCHVNLCKLCVGEHISSDLTFRHEMVTFKNRRSTPIYPNCTEHDKQRCEMHCRDCDKPLCSLCVENCTGKKHILSALLNKYNAAKETIRKETDQLERTARHGYQTIQPEIEKEISEIPQQYAKVVDEVCTEAAELHQKIDDLVKQMKEELTKMETQHIETLQNQLSQIKKTLSEMDTIISENKDILDSNNVKLSLDYKSQVSKYADVAPEIVVSLPTFTPGDRHLDQLSNFVGKLSPSLFKPIAPPRDKGRNSCTLAENPKVITTINTDCKKLGKILLKCGVIWICDQYSTNILSMSEEGEPLTTISVKVNHQVRDIAVSSTGELIYIDNGSKTVNMIRNNQIETIISLQPWTPLQVFCSVSGDLLIIIHDRTSSKLVRYSGKSVVQSIQFDQGKHLYSSTNKLKYVTENINRDICVADNGIKAVVVVNGEGKFRFRYTGRHSMSKGGELQFKGIATDFLGNILVADCDYNHCIHIIDKDGKFLRYVDNCELKYPFALCVQDEHIFVGEYYSGKMKKIKYLMCE
ncbi:E3 ubiquitin-protein ligase TRIM71-like [Ostrea edulis]|uniref:E3 ubiquitin-protein ligase TRIM71-like n=1 Tax=Ostrea edulis TaxID=37623 RepID=UPI0024AE8CE8|nr:E3 ubiquitin-protein ligase TRIM71-like [Ostrea edulis]